VRPLTSFLLLGVLAGCAQISPQNRLANPHPERQSTPAPGKIADFVIPADALGARDPQLSAVLIKTGALAARQPRPTTITVAALPQDFGYLNQAIRRGIPSQRAMSVRIENMTVGTCQPYRVQVKTAD
jgi:hypothetical protein